eukprot:259475_1
MGKTKHFKKGYTPQQSRERIERDEKRKRDCETIVNNLNSCMTIPQSLSMHRNPSVMKNIERIKRDLQQNGFALRDYFNNDCPIQDQLKFVAAQKYLYKINLSQCIDMTLSHIANSEQCKLFYRLKKNQCMHTILGISSSTLSSLLRNYIKRPSKYISTIFNGRVSFILWMHATFTNSLFIDAYNPAIFPNNYIICYDCLVTFWSNSSYYHSFLKYSDLPICDLHNNLMSVLVNYPVQSGSFPKTRPPDTDESLKKVLSAKEFVYRLVIITDLWHKFLAHPQFMRYFLFNNITIFASFIKYWDNTQSVCHSYHMHVKIMVENLANDRLKKHLESTLYYHKYIMYEYMDISCIFYSMIKQMKKKHILGENGMIGNFLNHMQTMIGSFSRTNNYFQCVLNLIWGELMKQYKRYNVNINQFLALKLVLLPTNCNTVKHIRQTILIQMHKRVVCGNKKCNNKSKKCSMKLCSRCKLVYYCHKSCQKVHWKYYHRYNCTALS